MKKITLSFEYNGRPCSAVIQVREVHGGRAFVVTPRDEDLNKLLAGNAVIREAGGQLEADVLAEQVEQTRLKLVIASGLSEYLKLPCFAGDGCLTARAHMENWEELHPLLRHERHPDASVD